jgi:hypothetical protein
VSVRVVCEIRVLPFSEHRLKSEGPWMSTGPSVTQTKQSRSSISIVVKSETIGLAIMLEQRIHASTGTAW